ncbi:MAG: amino acid racemase [Thermovirgaceae bacterium]|nr:amino acid racemase [Thermovirgaceae bacterium]
MSPKPHKVLGVLGGMGPAATAEFLRLLAELAGAERDQDHPQILLFSNPRIPDRTAAIIGGGEDPAPAIFDGLRQLESWGADLLAVPCNTAHVFIDRFRTELKAPLVHIVEETVARSQAANPDGAWLLATSGTSSSGIYSAEAERRSYPLYTPGPETQAVLQDVIALVKSNRLDESGAMLGDCVFRLWKERDIPVVAACTELPLAYGASGLDPARMVSSLESLALGCLEKIYSPF